MHWAAAALIVGNSVITDGMQDEFDANMMGGVVGAFVPACHVCARLTLLGIVILCLIVRIIVDAPKQPVAGVAAFAASAVHWILYAMMIAVPLVGVAAWFFGVDQAAGLHFLVIYAMIMLILRHAAIAIFHHYVLRDVLLGKMTPLR